MWVHVVHVNTWKVRTASSFWYPHLLPQLCPPSFCGFYLHLSHHRSVAIPNYTWLYMVLGSQTRVFKYVTTEPSPQVFILWKGYRVLGQGWGCSSMASLASLVSGLLGMSLKPVHMKDETLTCSENKQVFPWWHVWAQLHTEFHLCKFNWKTSSCTCF